MIDKQVLINSYLFAYNVTGNVHYLKELRKIDNYFVDTMKYVFKQVG